jgi:surfeit locus 1 family protein
VPGIVRLGAFAFSPRIGPTIGAAVAIALTLSLGRWQADRAQEKEARQALLEARMSETPVLLTGAVDSPEPLVYRHVRAAGQWVAEGQIFIDNQIVEGRAGFHVVTPLRLEGRKEAVLVNRGWVARSGDYPRAPGVAVPSGRIEVAGVATLPPKRVLELSADTISGNVWQNLSIERYRNRTGNPVLPIVILADRPARGLMAVRERPDAGIAKHREYALTWFALAATVLALWIVLNVRRAR